MYFLYLKVFVERTEDYGTIESLYRETCDLFSSLAFKKINPDSEQLKQQDEKLQEMAKMIAQGSPRLKTVEVWHRSEWDSYYGLALEEHKRILEDPNSSRYENKLEQEARKLQLQLVEHHIQIHNRNEAVMKKYQVAAEKSREKDIQLV